MAWVNYRDTLDRFGHIDGEFVRSSAVLAPESGTAEVVIRFYPWWEHPLYLAARERGEGWGFSDYSEGAREVFVRAIRPWAVRISQRQTVTDWSFTDSHPLLWEFGSPATLYVNAAFDSEKLLAELLAMKLPFVFRNDLLPYVSSGITAVPRAITVPSALRQPVLDAFDRLGIPVFAPKVPDVLPRASVFLIDGEDYIIADDFEVFVPEFVHDVVWFNPDHDGGASNRTA